MLEQAVPSLMWPPSVSLLCMHCLLQIDGQTTVVYQDKSSSWQQVPLALIPLPYWVSLAPAALVQPAARSTTPAQICIQGVISCGNSAGGGHLPAGVRAVCQQRPIEVVCQRYPTQAAADTKKPSTHSPAMRGLSASCNPAREQQYEATGLLRGEAPHLLEACTLGSAFNCNPAG